MREKHLSLSQPENTKQQSKIITDRETSCESSPSLISLSLSNTADSPRTVPRILEPEGTYSCCRHVALKGVKKSDKQQKKSPSIE